MGQHMPVLAVIGSSGVRAYVLARVRVLEFDRVPEGARDAPSPEGGGVRVHAACVGCGSGGGCVAAVPTEGMDNVELGDDVCET